MMHLNFAYAMCHFLDIDMHLTYFFSLYYKHKITLSIVGHYIHIFFYILATITDQIYLSWSVAFDIFIPFNRDWFATSQNI